MTPSPSEQAVERVNALLYGAIRSVADVDEDFTWPLARAVLQAASKEPNYAESPDDHRARVKAKEDAERGESWEAGFDEGWFRGHARGLSARRASEESGEFDQHTVNAIVKWVEGEPQGLRNVEPTILWRIADAISREFGDTGARREHP